MTNKLYLKTFAVSSFILVISGCGQGSGAFTQSSVSFSQNPIVLTRGSVANVIPVYSGDKKPIACQATPALPDGLILNPDCSISGTPVAPTNHANYDLQATYQLAGLSFNPPETTFHFQTSLEVAPGHIYIGEPYTSADQGSFYECGTDGSNCRQILSPVKSSLGMFGYSLSANKSGVFIGAPGQNSVYLCPFPVQSTTCKKLDVPDNGSVVLGESVFATNDAVFISNGPSLYKCDANGANCALLKTPGNFGLAQAIFVTKQNILTAEYDVDSKIRLCDTGANNCNIIIDKQGVSGGPFDGLGSSLFLTDNAIYIGAKYVNSFTDDSGTVYKCNIDGSNCAIFTTSFTTPLVRGAGFGSSLAMYNGYLYSGAAGEKKVFKCSLDTQACSEFATGEGNGFGSSLAFF